MAKKVYKRQYTKGDVAILEQYIRKLFREDAKSNLYIEVWHDKTERDCGNGDVHQLSPMSLEQMFNIADKYYNNATDGTGCVELIYQDSKGYADTILHIERDFSGILYDFYNEAKQASK